MTDLADRRGMETEVYQPAEDTQLLLDAAREHVESGDLVLEVGTGSGYVAAMLSEESGVRVVGSDLNPVACREARSHGVEAVRANLVEPFRDGRFDLVVFNPPYLPENDLAKREDWMEVALTGGETGREVIEPFVETVGRVLTPGGRVLLLVSTLSGVDAVIDAAEEAGFSTAEVAEENFPFETLFILRLDRRTA